MVVLTVDCYKYILYICIWLLVRLVLLLMLPFVVYTCLWYVGCNELYTVWSSDRIRTTPCLSPSPPYTVVYCYIWWCWFVRRNGNNDKWMWMMMTFSPTISYILYGRKMRSVQQSITLFASLLLVLLLLLIVIYDRDGTYDETESIIMDCISTYMLNLLSCPGVHPFRQG